MVYRAVFVSAVLALKASAFLVVPEVAGDVIAPDILNLRPWQIQGNHQTQVNLFCSQCPFGELREDGEVHWLAGSETILPIVFTTTDGTLLLNDHQIFPPAPPRLIQTDQIQYKDHRQGAPVSLGYAVTVTPIDVSDPEPDTALWDVRFTVLDVEGQPVPVDTVSLTLLRLPSGELHMAKMEVEPTTNNEISWKNCSGKPQCLKKLLFDRVRALIADAKARMHGIGSRISGFKGCHGRPSVEGELSDDAPSVVDGHRDRFGDHRPGHHHPAHRHHDWERTFSRIVRFILVPAILGVLAGMTASILGMLVGQVVVFFWLRYRRGRRQASQSSPTTVEQGSEPEKQALMADVPEVPDDLPPRYSEEGMISPQEKH